MAYVGNVPAAAFSNTVKDSFSGDGSTVAFTLSLPTTTNNVRVVVENVIQDPTVAYGVSGTTLTFTSAPPSGTNNIYVVHLGPAVQTVQPPTQLSGNFTLTGDLTQTGDFTVTGDVEATNVSDGTTTVGTSFVVNGSAKAWVNFNGTGTIAARDSLNLSSLTDNGVGDYSVNVSSAFDAADYAVSLSNSRAPTTGNPPGFINIFTNNATGLDAAPTTSAFRLGLLDFGVGGRDVTYVCTFAHGDLA